MRRVPRRRRGRSGQARAVTLAYAGVVAVLALLLTVAILGWVARVA